MKITDVVVIKLAYPVEPPMADGVHFCTARTLVLVQVYTDVGIVGMGESAIPGAPMEVAESIILNELRPRLIGEDPFKVEYIWRKMAVQLHQHGRGGMLYMVMGGIDVALYDIIGQATKTPLYKLLGGYREKVLAYASAGFYRENKDARQLADECRGFVEKGFSYIKIKIGRSKEFLWSPLHDMPGADYATVTPEEDLERVRLVREAIGSQTKLAVDANNAWTPSLAIQMGKKLEKYHVFWIEEPVDTDDIEGSRHVAHILDVPICGYETCTSLSQFRELIVRRAIDIVSPSIMWCGGITETRKIAALAQAYQMPVTTHGFGSGPTLMANLHFMAAIPNGGLMEFDQNENPLRAALFNEEIKIDKQGYIRVPDRPGLGVSLAHSTIDKYRVK